MDFGFFSMNDFFLVTYLVRPNFAKDFCEPNN